MSLSEHKDNNSFRKPTSKSSSASLFFSRKPEDNFFVLAALGWLTMEDVARGARISKAFHTLILQVQQYAFLVKGRKIFAELTPPLCIEDSDEEESILSENKSVALEQKGAVPESILKILNCINGWIALGEGLIPVDELRNLTNQVLGIRANRFIDPEDSDFEGEDDKDPGYDKTKQRIKILIESKFGLMALRKKYLTFQDILRFRYDANLEIVLSTKYGLIALENRLAKIEELEVFYNFRSLGIILSENGILALKEKFMMLNDIPPVAPRTLELMLTPQGKAAIRAGVLTFKEACSLEGGIQDHIFSFWGLKMLSEGCLTLQQASILGELICDILMTEQGWYLLKNRLISIEQIIETDRAVALAFEQHDYYLISYLCPIIKAIVSTPGIKIIEDKLIPMERVIDMAREASNNKHIRLLFSENGHKALANNIITLDQSLTYSTYILAHILSDTAFPTFQTQFFTSKDVDEMLPYLRFGSLSAMLKSQTGFDANTIFKCIFSNDCYDAIQKGYATKEQVMHIPTCVAILFCTSNGRKLFEKGIAKFDDFLNFDKNAVRFSFITSNEGIEVLEKGLLTIEQVGKLEIIKYADTPSKIATLSFYLSNVMIRAGRLKIGYDLLAEFREKDHCQFLLDAQVKTALMEGQIGLRECFCLDFSWFREFFQTDEEFNKDKNALILIYLMLGGTKELLPQEFKYQPTSEKKQTPEKTMLNLLKGVTYEAIARLDSMRSYKTIEVKEIVSTNRSQLTEEAEVKQAASHIPSAITQPVQPTFIPVIAIQHGAPEQKQKSNIQLQATAFRKIYQALRKGQSNLLFYKTNFLSDNSHLSDEDLARTVENYSTMHPTSRTAKAWELTQIHYKDCSSNNTELFKEIYRWSFQSSHVFSLSSVMGSTFFRNNSVDAALNKNLLTINKIREGSAKKSTRTFNIAKVLGAFAQ